jgi:tetratricopeptide (TPR) repeat protein
MPDRLRVFMSYSRQDTDFVDRLEIDLSVRGVDTWLDRQDLAFKGGQRWEKELQAAIERSDALILIVSPAAVRSENVRAEYVYAQQIYRPLIALLHQPCPDGIPTELLAVEWINFTDSKPYGEAVNELLIKLIDLQSVTPLPRPSGVEFKVGIPPMSLENMPSVITKRPRPLNDEALEKLYEDGISAQAEQDLERAVIFWQRILDIRPDYLNGIVARQMNDLRRSLQQRQVQQLRQLAESSRKYSNWGRESAAWSAVLDLVPNDRQALSGRMVAEKHKVLVTLYDKAYAFYNAGKSQEASIQLKMLWDEAPDYGDPAKLAPLLGLIYPLASRPNPRPPEPSPRPSDTREVPKQPPRVEHTKGSGFKLSNNQTYAAYIVGGFIVGSILPPLGPIIGLFGGWYLARGVNRRREQNANK